MNAAFLGCFVDNRFCDIQISRQILIRRLNRRSTNVFYDGFYSGAGGFVSHPAIFVLPCTF